MAENLVEINNVTREFKRKGQQILAVNGVTLSVPKNKFIILAGKSGSGKTTLLNLIAGIDLPTSGEIIFDGRNLSALSETKRDKVRCTDVGIVFQNTALMANMSAIENVEFALSISGSIKGKRKQAITWLDKMGIRERRNHMPAEMSGGEQARVAIGRALAHSPKLLIADEPTAELDSKTSHTVVQMFKDLAREQNLTIIMTTHDVNMMDYADIVYTMEDGRVIDVREN